MLAALLAGFAFGGAGRTSRFKGLRGQVVERNLSGLERDQEAFAGGIF